VSARLLNALALAGAALAAPAALAAQQVGHGADRPARPVTVPATTSASRAAAVAPGSRAPVAAGTAADAAQRGDLAALRQLLARGADANAAQGDGMTALHWAADRGDSALAAALLDAKADPAARTRIGDYTPLHIAARAGAAAVVRALLGAGADVKATTSSGATALHLASSAGTPEVVQALLGAGADPNAKESQWGQTPLIFAAERDRAGAVAALLKAGADPSVRTRVVNLTEQAARAQAAQKKRDSVLISYEPKARRDSADADHKRALEAAKAQLAQLQAQQRAAQAPAGARDSGGPPRDPGQLVNAQNANLAVQFASRMPVRQPRGPFTPQQIQIAIDSGRAVFVAPVVKTDSVREQVDTANGGVAGYAKQVGSVGGLTALHHAARQGSVAAAVALAEGGAPLNDTSLVDRMTPLMIAAVNGQFDVAKALVERGADPNVKTTYGMSPLYAVLNSQWAPRTRYPQPQAIATQKTSYLDLTAALLAKGADPNARLGKQPWWFAYNNCGSFNCGLEVIDGTTPFWRAAYALDVDAMRLLKKHGALDTIPSTPPAPRARAGAAPAAPATAADSAKARVAADSAAKNAPPVTRVADARPARGGDARPAAGGAARPAGAGGERQPQSEGGFKFDPEILAMARVAPVGAGVLPVHAAAGVGYGNGFAGNAHRAAPDAWMPALRYLVEELGADVNARDNNGYTPLHHAAARGDNEMIKYLVSKGADVKAVSRNGRTVVDMANGPVQRLRPFPETIELLEKLGAKNQHHCVSC
jgi:ankyrin repeat protein